MKKRITLGVFLFLILTGPGMLRAQAPGGEGATAPSTSSLQTTGGQAGQSILHVKTYEELRHAISEARAQSRTRVEEAVEQERVREAWEIGRLIDAHVLQHKEKAGYAEHVLTKLSGDLGMSERELYYSLRFYRAYPILPHAAKLSWSEYRDLLSVNDSEERKTLAERAEKENWNRDRLRKEVKALKGTGSSAAGGVPVPLEEDTLTVKPGKVGTYRVVKETVGPETGRWVIDLGFSNYYKTSKDLRFKEGAILEAVPSIPGASAPSDMIRLSKRTSTDLYTYRAYVVRVLDGDTVEVVVDLGFGVRSVQTLRLRRLDALELVSKEGKEAKAFVESVITKQFILIKTVKSDKYDRYLADVFYTDKAGKQQYLNNVLLEKGHAVRVQA